LYRAGSVKLHTGRALWNRLDNGCRSRPNTTVTTVEYKKKAHDCSCAKRLYRVFAFQQHVHHRRELALSCLRSIWFARGSCLQTPIRELHRVSSDLPHSPLDLHASRHPPCFPIYFPIRSVRQFGLGSAVSSPTQYLRATAVRTRISSSRSAKTVPHISDRRCD
jgi:hypothetical protein